MLLRVCTHLRLALLANGLRSDFSAKLPNSQSSTKVHRTRQQKRQCNRNRGGQSNKSKHTRSWLFKQRRFALFAVSRSQESVPSTDCCEFVVRREKVSCLDSSPVHCLARVLIADRQTQTCAANGSRKKSASHAIKSDESLLWQTKNVPRSPRNLVKHFSSFRKSDNDNDIAVMKENTN